MNDLVRRLVEQIAEQQEELDVELERLRRLLDRIEPPPPRPELRVVKGGDDDG